MSTGKGGKGVERNALSEDAPFHSQTMRLFSGSVIAAGHQHGHDGVVVVISGLDAFGKLHVGDLDGGTHIHAGDVDGDLGGHIEPPTLVPRATPVNSTGTVIFTGLSRSTP